MPTKNPHQARDVFFRYKSAIHNAQSLSRKRLRRMRKALNRELKREGAHAFQRRKADKELLSEAARYF
jgi:peptide methionine sulfoxide reductase MsrA